MYFKYYPSLPEYHELILNFLSSHITTKMAPRIRYEAKYKNQENKIARIESNENTC